MKTQGGKCQGCGRPARGEGKRKFVYLREDVFRLWNKVKSREEFTRKLSNSEFTEYLLRNVDIPCTPTGER